MIRVYGKEGVIAEHNIGFQPMRLARIPVLEDSVGFDFDAQPGLDRQQIHELVTLSFLDFLKMSPNPRNSCWT